MTKTRLAKVAAVAMIATGLIAASPGYAQKTMMFKAEGDVFLLPEFGAVLIVEDDRLKVEMMAPKERLAKDYQEVDLLQGDFILMINGKRTKTIDDFRSVYDDLKPGDEIKLGIKRDESMRIASFSKGDEDSKPQGMMMTLQTGGEGEGGDAGEGRVVKRMTIGGSEDMLPLIELGMVLAAEDDKLIVKHLLPNAGDVFADVKIAEGDVLNTFQAEPVKSLDEFKAAWEEVKIGETVKLGFSRDSEQYSASLPKPEAAKNMMIREKKGQ
ncbi:MAG: PDZ domain-containing protein [Candidatus Zixiibacteriota bacterium]|nr:MAG: PDZ domain-containing protein [candidate division Zixibacteria bacterium]